MRLKNRNRKARIVGEMKLPDSLIIALIKRGNKALIPQGKSRLLAGDNLIVFSLLNKDEVKGYFE